MYEARKRITLPLNHIYTYISVSIYLVLFPLSFHPFYRHTNQLETNSWIDESKLFADAEFPHGRTIGCRFTRISDISSMNISLSWISSRATAYTPDLVRDSSSLHLKEGNSMLKSWEKVKKSIMYRVEIAKTYGRM